jgi:hypothetical protein
MAGPKSPLRLDVDRVGFVRSFRALQAAESGNWRRATVSFDGAKLNIEFGEVVISIEAAGTWGRRSAYNSARFSTTERALLRNRLSNNTGEHERRSVLHW